MDYKIHDPIPTIKYTADETATWKFCYDKLNDMFAQNACKEYNDSLYAFKRDIGLRSDEIIQLETISTYL